MNIINERLETLKEIEEMKQIKWCECDHKKTLKKWHKLHERLRILNKIINEGLENDK